MRVGLHSPQQRRQLIDADVSEIFHGFGEEKLVQAFQRIMGCATGDAGEVVDFLAHAAHSAGLFDNAGLLHAV
ncbi:hypothetical protein D3C76_1732670 [compost metagenome]